MRAVNRENLKRVSINVTDPAGNIRGLSIPGVHLWIAIRSQPGLPGRELLKRAERKPGVVPQPALAGYRRQKKTHDRHAQKHANNSVEPQAKLRKHLAP